MHELAARAPRSSADDDDCALAQHQLGKCVERGHRTSCQSAVDLVEFGLVRQDFRVDLDQSYPGSAVEIKSARLGAAKRPFEMGMAGQDEIDVLPDRPVELTERIVFLRPLETAILLKAVERRP